MVAELSKKKRDTHVYGNINIIGSILTKYIGLPKYYGWLNKMSITKNNKILDIGCGAGRLFNEMYNAGFTNLSGADFFIKNEIVNKNLLYTKKKFSK